ncbi:MAG: hypothetical protein ABIS27_00195 [Longimicrobiales bacterium]
MSWIRLTTALGAVLALSSTLQAQTDTVAAPPQVQLRAPGAYMNVSFVGLLDAAWSTESRVRSLWVGDHDPRVRGFTIPNGEFVLDGAVDPYFQGFANIVYKLDENGETGVELEEMYALTTSLPHNLQLKAGQFFAEFGRQNPQHPHSWAFGDQPLVLNRVFGGENLRSQGVRASWLAPTPFYTEVMLGVMNATGETAFSFRSEESAEIHGGIPVDSAVATAADLLFVPRIASSFDLSDTQTLLFGVSGAFGPNNSGTDSDTRIMGVDVYWKWKSPRAEKGFPFVSLQGEAMARSYQAGPRVAEEDGVTALSAETLKDAGAYGQVLWGIKPLIVAALRGEFVNADASAFTAESRADRYRISTNMTWYPTEFSKFRLQYNYDHRQLLGVDHSLMAQLEFLLGAHAAHKF